MGKPIDTFLFSCGLGGLFLTRPQRSGIPWPVSQPALKYDALSPALPLKDERSEPTDELAPDEPRTPAWLTATGGVLFLLAIVWFIASRPAKLVLDEPSAPASAEAQP